MIQGTILLGALMLSTITTVFGQKISETGFELGINKTSSPEYKHRWNDDAVPSYFTIKTSKSWYNNNHRFSLRKELGLKLQHAGIDLSCGGLGGGSSYKGNIISLFADAALLAQFKINNELGIGIGPEAEILIIGKNNLNNSYSCSFCNPRTLGEKHIAGFNRDYFNQPAYGIKLSLFETDMTKKNQFWV